MGLQGQSYAIPTKDENLKVLSLERIKEYVNKFIQFVEQSQVARPHLRFQITRIGCGLAGYKDEQIGPMFASCPDTCFLPPEWKEYRERFRGDYIIN